MSATPLPFSLSARALENFLAGRCRRFRRPADGMYKNLKRGDQLWLREPFHLPERYYGRSPTQAAMQGVKPIFALDLEEGQKAGLGQKRPSRTLLREWHRFHAFIEGIEIQTLDQITEAEALAEGFHSREHWIEDWDNSVSSFGQGHTRGSAKNPKVLVLTLKPIRHPLALSARTSNKWKEPA